MKDNNADNFAPETEQKRPTSKYELTLAEFPMFILSKKRTTKLSVIEYRDSISGRDGKPVERVWKVYPDAKYGFGGASTQQTLFELFQLWKDQGFHSQRITFGAIHSLIKRRGMANTKTAYEAIRKDLVCLVGMRVEAKNAYWDNEKKAYVDAIFHLFDDVFLFKEKPTGQAALPFGWIKASDVLWYSVEANSLLTTLFDSEFFHSLSPLEQRLALYLSKMFRSQTKHQRDIVKLAEVLPVHSKQKKKTKQTLKKTAQSLIEKGFTPLQSFDFKKSADGKSEIVVFIRSTTFKLPPSGRKLKGKQPKPPKKEDGEFKFLVDELVAITEDPDSRGFYQKICHRLPKEIIYRILGDVKEEFGPGSETKFHGSKGMYVTVKAKQYAQEFDIALDLKEK